MNLKTSLRGFKYAEFKDASRGKHNGGGPLDGGSDGVTCSIQESSSAEEQKIWLGIDMTDAEKEQCFESWWTWPPNPAREKFPKLDKEQARAVFDSVQMYSRMELNQAQVAELVPHLEEFVKNGEL